LFKNVNFQAKNFIFFPLSVSVYTHRELFFSVLFSYTEDRHTGWSYWFIRSANFAELSLAFRDK